MRLTRCFVPAPLRRGDTPMLPRETAAHVLRVLRLRAGAALVLFDGRGGEHDGEILQIEGRAVRVRVGEHRAIERESPLSVTLLQALARGERMDFIVQKATELGVTAVVPFSSARSVVRLEADAAARRCEHWHAIVIGACEQCGRNRIPIVHEVTDLQGACAQADARGLRLLLAPDAQLMLPETVQAAAPVRAEAGGRVFASEHVASITLLIGPEGGFCSEELAFVQDRGFQGCRLGPRVLRTETAPIAALAAIQAIAGDFAR